VGTKGEKMVARRRKKNSRRSRVTNVNLTELGAGLALASAAGAPTIVAQVQKADFGAAFKTLSDAFTNKETQKKMVGIGISAVLAKAASKSLRVRRIAKIGPLALNI
jgi:hypothetical protein